MSRALVFVVGIALVPAVAPTDIFRPSKSDQLRLGQQAADELRRDKKVKVLPDSDIRVQTLRRLGRMVEQTWSDKNSPWKFSYDVIDSPEINAFALPGGPTFFYTGLLDRMKTEDELLAVVGHEIQHVRAEHWARGYADQQKRRLGLAIILGAARANRETAEAAILANGLLFTLPFSRRYEFEADDAGYQVMVKNGYNPQGMADVFTMLGQAAGSGKPPEWLSTHPSDSSRIKRVTDRVRRDSITLAPLRPLPFETKAMRDAKTGVIGEFFRGLIAQHSPVVSRMNCCGGHKNLP